MSAEPLPEVGRFVPATVFEVGHPLKYVVRIVPEGVPDDEAEFRSTCGCHPFWLIDPVEGEAAWERNGQRWKAWSYELTLGRFR